MGSDPKLCVLSACHARAQEHFYLEPNCSLVVPGEAGEITIISSTQVRSGGVSQAQGRMGGCFSRKDAHECLLGILCSW